MAVLALKKSVWEAGTDLQRAVMRYGFADILIRSWEQDSELGNPARYRDPGGDVWFIWDDQRFDPKVMCYFGCFCANITDVPSGYTLPATRAELRSDMKAWIENPARANPLVKLGDVAFGPDDANPWQTLLDAQGTPAWVKMAASVPPTWMPVGEE